MDIRNKTIIVTGGAVRLGREVVLELAASSANIVCQYFSSKQEAKLVKKKAELLGAKLELVEMDLTLKDAASQIVQKALDAFGSIDVLVNNSAVFYPTPLATVSEKDWDTFNNLNLKAAFFCPAKLV